MYDTPKQATHQFWMDYNYFKQTIEGLTKQLADLILDTYSYSAKNDLITEDQLGALNTAMLVLTATPSPSERLLAPLKTIGNADLALASPVITTALQLNQTPSPFSQLAGIIDTNQHYLKTVHPVATVTGIYNAFIDLYGEYEQRIHQLVTEYSQAKNTRMSHKLDILGGFNTDATTK